jgi:hypothetical protein
MVIVNGGCNVCEYAILATPSISSPARIRINPPVALVVSGRSPWTARRSRVDILVGGE